MPTTLVRTVGTSSRQYATKQLWEDASPANLVTSDNIWKGEMYADSEFTGKLTLGGITTDATRYMWLTTAAGESAYDDSANPLVYDATKGVAVSYTWSGDENFQFDWSVPYSIVEKIQWKLTNTSGGYYPTSGIDLGQYVTFRNGIVEANVRSGASTAAVLSVGGYYGYNEADVQNILIVLTADTATDNACSAIIMSAGRLYNVGVVVPTGLTNPSTGDHFLTASYQSDTLIKSCYSFGSGGVAFSAGTWRTGSDYNASDDTSGPGANSTDSLTYADQFVSTTNTNWKLKSGSGMIANGNTDSSYPNDIYGTVRATTTGGDVGPYEYVAAASGGRIMSSLAYNGGLAGMGGIAGAGGGLAG